MHFILDTASRSCFNSDMTTTQNLETGKTCECGCGAPVARSFRPGHDAILKSALVNATKANQWWTRENAIKDLVNRGWGRFIPAEIVGNHPTRSRHNGRFVETRHINNLQVWVSDEAGKDHSHTACPAIVGSTVKGTQQAGWACSACIHTAETAEIVASRIETAAALVDNEVAA